MYVVADALPAVTTYPASPKTNVYVVPVWVFIFLVTYATVPPAPNATVLPSVAVVVYVFCTVNVLLFAKESVPEDEVMVRPLILVAVAAPNTGATNVGAL